MSKFIKFTNFLLHTNDIHKIVILPNKYRIHIISKHISGFYWGISIFGFGSISSYISEIEVCIRTLKRGTRGGVRAIHEMRQ
jgi:hypothetical protein